MISLDATYREAHGKELADEVRMQETLNFWKQISHVMKYFREQENPTARLPQNFMQGFLEVSFLVPTSLLQQK